MDTASSDPEMMQMATTLTFALLIPDATVLIGHVGDSRAYIGDGTDIIQVTNDHTVAMDKVGTGELSLADAEHDHRWHVLSNWIGWEPHRLETWELRVEPGDRLLLCSDGLSNMIDDDSIAELRSLSQDPQFIEIRPLRDNSTANYVLTAVEGFETLRHAVAYLDSEVQPTQDEPNP